MPSSDPPYDRWCFNCVRKNREQAEKFRQSGVGRRHAAITRWDDLADPEGANAQQKRSYGVVRDALKRFVFERDTVMALIGNRGTGKTQMTGVAVADTIRSGKAAKMATSMELMADLKRRYGDEGSAEVGWLETWTHPYLLVIDEFQRKHASENCAVMLEELVDRRYKAMRPTVIIANVSRDDFISLVGPSIASRCNENGGVLDCDWPSFRS